MKKTALLAAALLLAAGLAYAAEAAKPAEMSKAMTFEGTIIDNQCASQNKANLPEFIKTHPKSCALMPNCAASGYSLYMPDGKLMAFDKESNAKILAFLKKKSSKLTVVIKASEVSGELKLASIKNAPAAKKPAK